MGVSEQLHISVTRDSARVTLVLSGELDLASAPLLVEALEGLDSQAGVSVVLDLEGLQFIDSTGLRSIIAARSQCRERGQELSITRGSAQVERLLNVTGLASHLSSTVAPGEAPAA